jgi:hypothetical protein
MTRQIPAERRLPNKQLVLDRILDETGTDTDTDTDTAADPRTDRHRRSWALPIAAAAAIAIVATGALTVPKLLKSDDAPPPAGQATTAVTTSKPADNTVSIDRGKLTAAQASDFATECIKWVGSKDIPGQTYGDAPLDWPGAGAKVDEVLHATKVADSPAGGASDWTVAVRSGGRIYACVGHPTVKDPDGRVRRDYDFTTFSTKYPDGLGGNSDGIGANSASHGLMTLSTSRWLVAPATAVTAQRRIVVNGKPGPWFSTAVVGGVGYLRAWGQAKLVLGDKVRAETRFLDSSDRPVGRVVTMSTTFEPVGIPGDNRLALHPDN